MSERKVVRRSVAVAVGIVCILLLAGLGVVMAYYTMQINNKDSTYNDYVLTHSHTNSEYDSLQSSHHHSDSEYNALQNQVNDLTDTLNLGKSTTWINDETISQSASSYTYWTFTASSGFVANYAGYISVNVQSSTTDKTYVQVIYSSHGVNYNNQIGVGSSGTAVFPVLPSSSTEIRVGNNNIFNGATETVTITYYY
ncbi:MAG: hypothetical protein ABSF24_12460 [Candidatus Bathyarchaeia archaeon]